MERFSDKVRKEKQPQRPKGNNSEYKIKKIYISTCDQPQAIEQLVTGSGKTFTMANVIQQLNKPMLIITHNKTLVAQLYGEFKEFFPNNAVEYFVS